MGTVKDDMQAIQEEVAELKARIEQLESMQLVIPIQAPKPWKPFYPNDYTVTCKTNDAT